MRVFTTSKGFVKKQAQHAAVPPKPNSFSCDSILKTMKYKTNKPLQATRLYFGKTGREVGRRFSRKSVYSVSGETKNVKILHTFSLDCHVVNQSKCSFYHTCPPCLIHRTSSKVAE